MLRGIRPFSCLFFLIPCLPGEGATIDHGGVACVVAGKFPRIDARITPPERVAKARTFFHADDDASWYYVEMTADAGEFRGVLPKPLKATKRIHYYVEATDKDVSQARTQEFAAEVVADAAACPNRGMVAAMAVASKVVVGVPAGAAATPAGFAGNSVAAAGAAGGAAGGAGGGIGTAALVVGGVVIAGGAAVAAVAAGGGDEGGDSSNSGPNTPFVFEGVVYSDTCCPPGPVDPSPAARVNSRRIAGAVISTSLDSATTTSDAQGAFRLTTQTRCQGASTFTLRIVAAGCDPLGETRSWNCNASGQAMNLACR